VLGAQDLLSSFPYAFSVMLRQLSQAESDLRRLGQFIHDALCNINKILTPTSPDKSDIVYAVYAKT
jgi:hypothetical protein